MAHAVEVALEQIMEFNRAAGKEDDGTILLLGRYTFDGDMLERSGLFEYKKRGSKLKSVKYPKLDITFMTVHMSKGLGYDNVIVINGRNETYGFPSKIEDDPVLSFVIRGDDSIDYAEERRLFYVAMTRTKNRVYFIAPEKNPSEFLLEIKRDYKNVVLKENWNEEEIKHNIVRKICPICGYPMQLRYKSNYGLRLYLCTNEPEICGFMTNDYRAGKLAIMKCEDCRDGYLIAKANKGNGYFLGCTNYSVDRRGCNNTIGSGEYYTLMNYSEQMASEVKKIRSKEFVSKSTEKQQIEKQNLKTQTKENVNTERVIVPNESKKVNEIYYKGFNLYEVVECLLNCLEHISEKRFYSTTILIATVRGGNRKQIREGNLMDVPEYNSYPDMSRDDMWAIVTWLIDNHYMLRTKEYYKKLHPTYEGRHFVETLNDDKLKKLKVYLEEPSREVVEENEKG